MKKLSSFALVAALSTFAPIAQPPAAAQQSTTPNIVIPLGQVVTIDVKGGITTFVLGNAEIARVTVPPGQSRYALVTAMKPGVTNMLIWTEDRETPINYVIEVSSNLRNEQIAVRVKVLEVEVGNDGKYGVDWSDFVSFAEATPDAPFRFGLPVRTSVLNARIDTLINERKARLLAEPTLVLLNGKEGEFLSGGELPLIITDRDRINVQWREYGIHLKLKALIEGADTIQMTLNPEVSDIDRANSITIANQAQGGSFVVPAFKTRRADSTLRVGNNQAIVIAGLLRNDKQEVIQKFPLLGDIPILGWLFRTVDFVERRSELVFIVTPNIVRDPMIRPEAGYGKDAEVEKPAP
ncbi:MAG: pilus assembly protein N-terminal domain-containing protein [Candidatus Sericytochromatia bacterium]